jgi:hypothetical protein
MDIPAVKIFFILKRLQYYTVPLGLLNGLFWKQKGRENIIFASLTRRCLPFTYTPIDNCDSIKCFFFSLRFLHPFACPHHFGVPFTFVSTGLSWLHFVLTVCMCFVRWSAGSSKFFGVVFVVHTASIQRFHFASISKCFALIFLASSDKIGVQN